MRDSIARTLAWVLSVLAPPGPDATAPSTSPNPLWHRSRPRTPGPAPGPRRPRGKSGPSSPTRSRGICPRCSAKGRGPPSLPGSAWTTSTRPCRSAASRSGG